MQPASSNFSTLSRVVDGLCGYGSGFGFSLGGRENSGTDLTLPSDSEIFTPGLVIYDTSSKEWFNVSSTGYSSSGTASRGAAQFVPQFGPRGILFVFGGDANEAGAYVSFVRAISATLVESAAASTCRLRHIQRPG